jgi:hypothetical protein
VPLNGVPAKVRLLRAVFKRPAEFGPMIAPGTALGLSLPNDLFAQQFLLMGS